MSVSSALRSRLNLLVALGFIVLPLAWMLPTFFAVSGKTNTASSLCQTKMQRIGAALKTYAERHNGKLPAKNWVDELSPIISDQDVFRCPNDKTTGRSSYALNAHLVGKKWSDIPPETVLLYETKKAGDNPIGIGDDVVSLGKKDLVTGNNIAGGRHNSVGYRLNYYLFADNTIHHTPYVADLKKYRW